jgi:flagellar basal body-associated protein FliL
MRNLKIDKTKILLIIVAVALAVSFLGAVVFFASQPATVKVEYARVGGLPSRAQ